jgi:hypothetical protein
MKRMIIFLVAVFALTLALTGCGNENLGFGNYTYTHCHYSDGVEGQCVTVDSWHDNEIGCEIHTPTGSIYLSEGTYQLYESNKVCPYCGE